MVFLREFKTKDGNKLREGKFFVRSFRDDNQKQHHEYLRKATEEEVKSFELLRALNSSCKTQDRLEMCRRIVSHLFENDGARSFASHDLNLQKEAGGNGYSSNQSQG